ncbi:peptidylprolyl isomerase [Ruminiclostridium cellulolyticum]|uniref:peptidylprolyl isomerase n=1 Tax=Ruminiclostridium cellulolyticum (strain ATCC 35319 / DSM 5812 / JCM 6584 / H10) TaxID=394503 RepID=B8I055_RUMCH|nr:peptidylprolyl isomerase [Ruminiclostridium cellulolyticum]ACL77381.1 PpiC-type peptidyl-prolyl cis-trans isomerase [Ruminiclostridium cellulolyticum H10]
MENENAKVKKTSKGLIIGIIAAVLVVAVIAVVVIFSMSSGDVGKVGELSITKQEYLVLSKFNMNSFLQNAQSADPAKFDWNQKYQGSTAKEQIKKATLDSIQEIKIQLIKAKEAGIKLEKTDLDNIEAAINQRIQNAGGSRSQADKQLKQDYGVSLADYKEVYKELVLSQKYIESERNKVKVPDEEVKKQYDDHKADYDKVTVTHILIATQDLQTGAAFTEGKKKEAKDKAENLLKQIQEGADMQALAEKNSDDKDQNGAVNNKGVYTFVKGQMVPQFEDWAFANRKAGDTGIVETSYGYHVMRFEKREETKYDDVKDQIKSTILNKKFEDEFLTKKLDSWKKVFPLKKDEDALAKIDKTLYK